LGADPAPYYINLVQVENWSFSKGNREQGTGKSIGLGNKTQLRKNYGFQSKRGLCLYLVKILLPIALLILLFPLMSALTAVLIAISAQNRVKVLG
jgi:hypothetical protein